MSQISDIRANVANFFRSHFSSARDQNSAFFRFVEGISPQKQFWPEATSTPSNTQLGERSFTVAEPQPEYAISHSKQQKAEAWVDKFYNQHSGFTISDSRLIQEAIQQNSKGRPLHALKLLEREIGDVAGEISLTLPGTRNPNGGTDDSKVEANQRALSHRLKQYRDTLLDITQSTNYAHTFTHIALEDTRQAIIRACENVLEEEG